MAPRVLAALALLARLADHGAAAQARIGIEDLRPAVAEPAVAHDQHPLAVGELARHGFHAEGAAAGNQHGRVGVIDVLEHAQDVLHHAHEFLGHVVERSVGVDHREFEQAIGIDIGQKSGHGVISIENSWAAYHAAVQPLARQALATRCAALVPSSRSRRRPRLLKHPNACASSTICRRLRLCSP
jgi:hypothetical protein